MRPINTHTRREYSVHTKHVYAAATIADAWQLYGSELYCVAVHMFGSNDLFRIPALM